MRSRAIGSITVLDTTMPHIAGAQSGFTTALRVAGAFIEQVHDAGHDTDGHALIYLDGVVCAHLCDQPINRI